MDIALAASTGVSSAKRSWVGTRVFSQTFSIELKRNVCRMSGEWSRRSGRV